MRNYLVLVAFAAAATARPSTGNDQEVLGSAGMAEKYLIELAPGETRWIEEDDKWAMRRVLPTNYLQRAFASYTRMNEN